MFLFQQTLKNAIHCSGVALHSGRRVALVLKPAEPDSGIRFRRVDLPGQPELPALWTHAIETPLCSTLSSGDVRVATVEHLMAALAALGVDNLLVELDGPEVPIMDGSAAPFVFLIECAGIERQDAVRRALKVRRPVRLDETRRGAAILPSADFSVRFEIAFESRAVRRQVFDGEITAASFKREIARARTFGFLHEVDQLRAAGLARGGSLDNAIVIDGDRILNEGGLRYEDEFVRHKVLDSIGDLYLSGGPIIGRFEADRAGHALTLRLLRALFAESDAFEWVPMTALSGAPAAAALAVAQIA